MLVVQSTEVITTLVCWSVRLVESFTMLRLWVPFLLFNSLMFSGKVNARPSNPGDGESCTSQSCVKVSEELLSHMNRSVSPCEDMYQYACGGWIEATTSRNIHYYDRFSEAISRIDQNLKTLVSNNATTLGGKESSAIKKMKIFYNDCMDEKTIEEQGISKILQLISKLGSWTVTSAGIKPWVRTTWTLQTSLEKINRVSGDFLFGFGVQPDSKNTKRNILTFVQDGLTLSSPSQYHGSESQQKTKPAFLEYATTIATLLGDKEEEARPKMEQVFEFETKLAKVFVPLEQLQNPMKIYNKMTVGKFQTLLGKWINVKEYVNNLFQGRHIFSERDEVMVQTPDFYEKLGHIIEETDSEVLANYAMWHMIHSLNPVLPSEFGEAYDKMQSQLTGQVAGESRTSECLKVVTNLLGFVTSALYVEENFSAQSKDRVESILRDTQQAFMDNLDTVTWLDDVTRSKLKEKAESMELNVGYPDWIMDVDKLDERYAELTVEPGQFMENYISWKQFDYNWNYDQYNKEPDRRTWALMPEDTNAAYIPNANAVFVPAGFLVPPFYAPHYPDAYLYGVMGLAAGHELAHGFDSSGRLYDKFGNLADGMWTKEANDEFESHAECLVKQFSDYSLFGHKLNGKLTLAENIADNGGLKFAYQAFKKKKTKPSNLPYLDLTDEQLFFLGFSQCWCRVTTEATALQQIRTDVHSDDQYRVIGSLTNSDYFAQAFQCPSGAPLNPREKCRMW